MDLTCSILRNFHLWQGFTWSSPREVHSSLTKRLLIFLLIFIYSVSRHLAEAFIPVLLQDTPSQNGNFVPLIGNTMRNCYFNYTVKYPLLRNDGVNIICWNSMCKVLYRYIIIHAYLCGFCYYILRYCVNILFYNTLMLIKLLTKKDAHSCRGFLFRDAFIPFSIWIFNELFDLLVQLF